MAEVAVHTLVGPQRAEEDQRQEPAGQRQTEGKRGEQGAGLALRPGECSARAEDCERVMPLSSNKKSKVTSTADARRS